MREFAASRFSLFVSNKSEANSTLLCSEPFVARSVARLSVAALIAVMAALASVCEVTMSKAGMALVPANLVTDPKSSVDMPIV